MLLTEKEALAKSLGAFVTKAIAEATGPLLKRISDLEARQPEKGDPGEQGLPGERGEAGAQGDPGERGDAGERGEIGPQGEPGQAGPPGKDGVDGRQGPPGEKGDRGEQGIPGAEGKSGERGADGKDGIGLAGAVIDREGHLVVTLTNGTAKDLGPVMGKDGAPGEKGADGQDGADGVGFDDMTVEHDGERTIALRFMRGSEVKEFVFSIPVVIYRGIFKDGSDYEHGDCVTWGGSSWIAERKTSLKPGEPDSGWKLAVKSGRHGRDGKDGPPGLPGIAGPPGKDLTQLGPNGAKW